MTYATRTPHLSTSTRPITDRQINYLRLLATRRGREALAAAKRRYQITTPGIDGLSVSQAARLIDYLLNGEELR